jgi:16S rRNA (cytidine1402-2'-O)-methyltransferase
VAQTTPLANLTLVPTPIGNLEDITLRALRVLKSVDVIAAEDTRHARTLLQHHSITTRTVRLDAHTMAERAPALLEEFEHLAYISDAGTPGISDPGAELVRLALQRELRVEVLPGATALIPALVLSGLPLQRFTFEGFLPRKGAGRRERLAAIAEREHTSAIYESAQRLAATLADLRQLCGDERPAAFARELSKRFEEVRRGSLSELAAGLGQPPLRGEVVLLVGPRVPSADGAQQGVTGQLEIQRAEALAVQHHQRGLWGKSLRAALEAEGVPRDLAYALAMRCGRPSGA